MIAWGVGAIPLNVQAKLECDEDLALVIRTIQIRHAKAFGWNVTRSLRRIKWFDVRRLASLSNTMIHK
jgi:hypothetical protein